MFGDGSVEVCEEFGEVGMDGGSLGPRVLKVGLPGERVVTCGGHRPGLRSARTRTRSMGTKVPVGSCMPGQVWAASAQCRGDLRLLGQNGQVRHWLGRSS